MAAADQDTIPILLVTANVGSVFEDPSKLLHLWLREFLGHVAQCRPAFIALHLQEVGGKTYEKSMEYVQEFIKRLCESDELRDYNRIRVYLDEDYNSAEHFTALGNLYFVQNTVDHVLMWNFLTHEWDPVEGKSIHTGSIETVASKEKAKFPQQFFPECKWSRKGFLRTRWFLSGTVFDLVNIHLFHDASNLAACEEYPSVYCKSRRRALVHTLERFHKDTVNRPVPYFVFGDFNFRCDTEGVIKKLTEDLTMHRVQNAKHDSTKVQYRDADGANVLTVGKKEFSHCDQSTFKKNWLRQFDRELDSLRSILYEYPITFPPSYPYEEDPLLPNSYMATRCPAWCDRILVSPAARKLISDAGGDFVGNSFNSSSGSDSSDNNSTDRANAALGVSYGIIGANVCMGDHKPVYLSTRIKTSQGILDYCSCDTHAPTTPRVDHPVPNISNSTSSDSNSSSNSHVNLVFSRSRRSGSNAGSAAKVNVTLSPDSSGAGSEDGGSLAVPCVTCTARIEQCLERNLATALESDHHQRPGAGAGALVAIESITTERLRPVVSISVFDTDTNLNVCMCAMYCSQARAQSIGSEIDGTVSPICPNCRNIIKHQPVEHRKTLISRRMMLANDIIVNRIDTHYLNTYTTLTGGNGTAADGSLQAHSRFEPYTPESAESHSPLPESYESSKGSRTTTTDTGTDGCDVAGTSVDEMVEGSGSGDGAGEQEDTEEGGGGVMLLLTDAEEKQPLIAHMSTTVATSTVLQPSADCEVSSFSTHPEPPSNIYAAKRESGKLKRVSHQAPKPPEVGNSSSGGHSGVSPRQLMSRLERLKRLADERRKQYGEWTRNRSRCDTAKSDNSSSGTLAVQPVGVPAETGTDAATTGEAPVLAKKGGNSVRQQGGDGGTLTQRPPWTVEGRDSEPAAASPTDGTFPTVASSRRGSLLPTGCCRRMCTIL